MFKEKQYSHLVAFILLPLGYYLGAKLAVFSTIMPGKDIAILWPPNSVLLTALILFQRRHYIPFALLSIASEIAADMPTFCFTESLMFGLANVIEATVASYLLSRWQFDPYFSRLGDVSKFILAGPFIGALTSAFIGAAIQVYFCSSETSYFESLRIWWFGDSLGLLIFTPLLLNLWLGSSDQEISPPLYPSDGFVVVVALAILAILVLAHGGILLGVHIRPSFLLLPFVIFVAARYEFRYTVLTVAIFAWVMVVLTTRGHNPFRDSSPQEAIISVQEFILIMSLMGLGLSCLLSQLRIHERTLEVTNQHLNELNQDLETRVTERTTQLSELNAQLTKLAMTDPLTGLLNRRAFMNLAQKEIEDSKRHNRPLGVIMFDIDHFKSINDRYGHPVGDLVLQRTARLIERVIRVGDTLARYGGEEFVLVAPETDLGSMQILAERMRQTLRGDELRIEQQCIRVTASFGVTMLDNLEEGLEQLLKRSDDALYDAKAAGRDCVIIKMLKHVDLSATK